MTELTAAENKYFETKGEVAPEEKVSTEVVPEKEEAKPDPKPETKAEEKPVERKVVDHGAFAEERRKRKELQTRLEAEAQKQAVLQGRLDMLEKLAKPQEPEVQFEQNPAEYLRRQTEKVATETAEIKKWKEEQAQIGQRQESARQFLQAYHAKAAEFRKTEPEFDKAYEFLLSNRDAELAAGGIDDPAERANMIRQEEEYLVQGAFRAGMNPADRLYRMAKARGFGPTPTKPRDAETGQFKEKLDNIKEGQDRAKGLGGTAGTAAPGKMSLEALAKMDPDEFAKISDKDWKKLWT